MLGVCTKRVCVCNNEFVCEALRLAFSCQTSAISHPFILIPWAKPVCLPIYMYAMGFFRGGGGVHKVKPFCLYIFVLLMQCLRVYVFAPVFSLCLCMT